MTAVLARSGVCGSCAYASVCSFPRDPRRPVFFCEEYAFATQEPATPQAHRASKSSLRTAERPASARVAGRDQGLCSDCANAPTCTFAKVEGGFWHCEEYC